MKKYLSLLFMLSIITGCIQPESRTWIIPVTIDPSDLELSPAQLETFESRRKRLSDAMEEGTLILKSDDPESHNRHQFRPGNPFYYLTGLDTPGSYLIMGNTGTDPLILSLPPRTIRSLIYDKEPLPAGQLKERYGADRVISRHEVPQIIDSILGLGLRVYTDTRNRELMSELSMVAEKSGNNPEFLSVSPMLDEMRVLKDPMEDERLQKACNITALALTRAMKQCSPGQYEFEMESVIEGTFLEYGAAMPGFPSIVGSGPNSTVLHYESNNRQMESGELLLMDIGAEYGYYSADITRTIPVNGRFSKEQATIYQLVLDAQHAAIEEMVPGNGFIEGHMAARKVIVDGLVKLGLITDPGSPWQIRFYILYPSSHYLGMDVHDVGSMGGSFARFLEQTPMDSVVSRSLEPGMVLTIEPGLYFREKGLEQISEIFSEEADSSEIAAFVAKVRPVYEKYLNTGVRIEDDILITATGNINLSRYAPKEIRDIEQIMR